MCKYITKNMRNVQSSYHQVRGVNQMRRDCIFLLLPAGICIFIGIALLASVPLEILSLSISIKSGYFIGGSLTILGLILFIASYTTPLSPSNAKPTQEETEFFNEFKIKYKQHAFKASFINLGVFMLLLPAGIYLALFVGIESLSGIAILLTSVALYLCDLVSFA